MDGLPLGFAAEVIRTLGLPGIIFIVWYFSQRAHEQTLARYESDMREMRNMYERNAELVRQYKSLAEELKDIIVLNTQSITVLTEAVKQNQFCPMVRLEKRAKGVQE